MSENIAPNAALQKPLGTQSPGGHSDLLTTAQKQEQVLAKYRETNAQLQAFKKKTEAAIAAETESLETEKKKTAEQLSELSKKHSESLEQFIAEREQALRDLAAKPIYDSAIVAQISRSIGSLRADNAQLRTDFTINFASFMDSFNTARQLTTKVASKDSLYASTETLQRRLVHLQSLLGKRCDHLAATITSISRPAIQLDVSAPVAREQKDAIETAIDGSHLHRPSPFLANWFSLNAGLLSNY